MSSFCQSFHESTRSHTAEITSSLYRIQKAKEMMCGRLRPAPELSMIHCQIVMAVKCPGDGDYRRLSLQVTSPRGAGRAEFQMGVDTIRSRFIECVFRPCIEFFDHMATCNTTVCGG